MNQKVNKLLIVSYAPVFWDFPALLTLNAGTLAVTLIALIIPSYLVTSIDPVRAIRFK